MKSRKSLIQLIRYGVIGLLSNVAGYLVFLLIVYMGVEPKLAMTFLYSVGAAVGFFGNKLWTFSHEGWLLNSAARYIIAHIGGYSINWLCLYWFVDRMGYSHQWVQAVAIFVVALYLFIVLKIFVFPEALNESNESK